jgi:hypothetical protein
MIERQRLCFVSIFKAGTCRTNVTEILTSAVIFKSIEIKMKMKNRIIKTIKSKSVITRRT